MFAYLSSLSSHFIHRCTLTHLQTPSLIKTWVVRMSTRSSLHFLLSSALLRCVWPTMVDWTSILMQKVCFIHITNIITHLFLLDGKQAINFDALSPEALAEIIDAYAKVNLALFTTLPDFYNPKSSNNFMHHLVSTVHGLATVCTSFTYCTPLNTK